MHWELKLGSDRQRARPVQKVCRKVGIEIVNDAQRMFCLNVKIDAVDNARALH